MTIQNQPQIPLAFETDRLILSLPGSDGAASVLDYLLRNREFHDPWFPARANDVFTIDSQAALLAEELAEFEAGSALPFWLARKDQPERIIGRFNLGHIIHGAFQSAIASYHLDAACVGQGLAAEAGAALIDVAFNTFGLHRIEANIRPENAASIALALRLGFELEGFSPRYLQIGGVWADHLHFVCLADGSAFPELGPARLTSDCLLVRPLTWTDCEGFLDFEIRCRGQQTPMTTGSPDGGKADRRRRYAQMMLEQQVGKNLNLGVFPAPDQPGRLAGLIVCQQIKALPFASCELYQSFDAESIRLDLAFESLRLVMDYLFTELGLNKVTSLCDSNNPSNLILLERLGFEASGVDRQAILASDGWQDWLRYDRFNPAR